MNSRYYSPSGQPLDVGVGEVSEAAAAQLADNIGNRCSRSFVSISMTTQVLRAVVLGCLAGSTLVAITPRVAFAITSSEYQNIGVSVPANATVAADVVVQDESGHVNSLDALTTRPTVLVIADYRCRTLCGPVLDFVVTALEQSGLNPRDKFQVMVVGLDPKNTADDAQAARLRHLPDNPKLAEVMSFFTADEASIARLTTALGYRYVYDSAIEQFVHPAAAFVLRADGRVSRVLTGVGLSSADMRLALVEAGDGRIGNLSDRIRLLCSAFDPAQGIYTPIVSRALAVASTATLVLLAGSIGFLAFSNRRGT